MRVPRPLSVVGSLLAATMLLSACGGSAEPEPAAAPAGERTLILYSGREEELVGPLIERFEQQSGITVEARYGSTTEMASQILEEGDRTPAQVFLSQDAGALGALATRFAPLPPEVTGAVPAAYSGEGGSWVGLTGRVRVVAYDGTKYRPDQVPGDVTEFTQPQWRGKVGIAPTNASFQAFVTALRVTAGDDAARAWLRGLAANDVQIFERNGAILEAVDTGAVDVGLINHYYWASAEGDPNAQRAKLRFGDPGSVSGLVNVTGAGILTGAAQSAEASELVRFLVSADAQRYFAEETAEYPLVAGVPGPAGVPTLDQLRPPQLDLNDLASLEQSVAMINEAGLV